MYSIVRCGDSTQEECSSVSTCSENPKVHQQSILKYIFRRENIWHNVVHGSLESTLTFYSG